MSRLNFEYALEAILRFEGGYVDHPADPGGATSMGITLATLSAWRGRAVTKSEVRTLTRAEAGAIYRARYWDAIRADELPPGLDIALFDCAVNSGPSRAIRLLQRALHLSQNGRMSASTVAATATMPTGPLIRAVCDERRAFLKALSTFPVFGRGWMARVAAVEKLALAHLATPAAASSRSPQPQEKLMETTKSLLASRTLWANAIGLVSVGLAAFGFNTTGLDAGVITEQLFQAVAAGSFIVSSLFRVLASKRLM
jgi:lysozyme family protein